MRRWLLLVMLTVAAPILFAAKPIFLITPTGPTTISLPTNGSTVVEYRITNQTNTTRTLTIKPIQGVTQETSFAGSCASPFTLAPNQSCLLHLRVNGSLMPPQILGGPVVCKTKCPSDSRPDLFLCAQPSTNNQLNITRGTNESAALQLSPARLSMETGTVVPSELRVTNLSSYVTVSNIQATLPPAFSTVTQNATECTSLLPGGTCRIYFTPNATPATPAELVPVQGVNSSVATFLMDIVGTTITAAPTQLEFFTNQTGTVTITNTGAANANNVQAIIPIGSPISVFSTSCPPALLPGGTCEIVFTSSQTTTTTTITIEGVDTNAEYISMKVLGFAFIPNLTRIGGAYAITSCSVSLTSTLTACQNNTNATCTPYGGIPSSNCFNTPSGIAFNPQGTKAYIANFDTQYPLSFCDIASDGSLTNCQFTSQNFGAYGVTLNPQGTIAYIVSNGANLISACPVDAQSGGILSPCQNYALGFSSPTDITLNEEGTRAYITNTGNSTVSLCTVDLNSGALSNCSSTANALSVPSGIALNMPETFAYITNNGNNTVLYCNIGVGGILTGCATTGSGFSGPSNLSIIFQDSPFAFIANSLSNTVSRCDIDVGGTLSSCVDSGAGAIFSDPAAIEFN